MGMCSFHLHCEAMTSICYEYTPQVFGGLGLHKTGPWRKAVVSTALWTIKASVTHFSHVTCWPQDCYAYARGSLKFVSAASTAAGMQPWLATVAGRSFAATTLPRYSGDTSPSCRQRGRQWSLISCVFTCWPAQDMKTLKKKLDRTLPKFLFALYLSTESWSLSLSDRWHPCFN